MEFTGRYVGNGGGELDLAELTLAAPFDERGFGDLKFFGDARKAPAFSAKKNEPLLSFEIIHSTASIHPVLRRSAAVGTTSCKDATVCDDSRKQATGGDKIFMRNCLTRIERERG